MKNMIKMPRRRLKYCRRCDLVMFTTGAYCPLCMSYNSRPYVPLELVKP